MQNLIETCSNLRSAQKESRRAEEGFHLKQRPQQVRQSSWQGGQGRGQLTVRCWERYRGGVVSRGPSHLQNLRMNKILPALWRASIFWGLVASSATVWTKVTLDFW